MILIDLRGPETNISSLSPQEAEIRLYEEVLLFGSSAKKNYQEMIAEENQDPTEA